MDRLRSPPICLVSYIVPLHFDEMSNNSLRQLLQILLQRAQGDLCISKISM
jgi:hypothetical protein